MRDVILRCYTPEDAYDLFLWMNDAETTRYLGNGFTKKFTLEEACERAKALADGDEAGECFVIADPENDAYLGECRLMLPDVRAKSAELAVVLVPRARGQGTAYSALRQLIALAFESLGYERLYLKCAACNKKALNLYSRLGFKTEGVLRRHIFADGEIRDAVIMGLLKDEYQKG